MQHLRSDAAWNSAVDKWAGYAGTAWSLTGGKYVDKMPVVGGIVNDQVKDSINDFTSSYHHDTVDQAANDITTRNGTAMQTTAESAASAAQDAIRGSGFNPYQIQMISATVSNASRLSFQGTEGENTTNHGGWTVS